MWSWLCCAKEIVLCWSLVSYSVIFVLVCVVFMVNCSFLVIHLSGRCWWCCRLFVMILVFILDRIDWSVKFIFVTQEDCLLDRFYSLVILQIFCHAFGVGNGQNSVVGEVGVSCSGKLFICLVGVSEAAESLSCI